MTLGELTEHGDFGIGTFNALDGEMVVVDGGFYQVKTDGVSYQASADAKTPFAVLTHFQADTSFALSGKMDFDALLSYLDKAIRTENLFYAIRIDGEFKGLKTRSVRAQAKPYRPLGEVIDEQVIFPFEVTEGSMVGFRFPEYTKEINVPGYHLHYLDDARKKGGHVLAMEEVTAMVSIDFIPNLYLALPESGDFHSLDLNKDRTDDLDKVEKLRN
ncbi:UNVERIFIED_CONTAM: hypothetical protein GTU68_061646 [Idotea baltica]|nr:hypothetical protein [Idotea baltica]